MWDFTRYALDFFQLEIRGTVLVSPMLLLR